MRLQQLGFFTTQFTTTYKNYNSLHPQTNKQTNKTPKNLSKNYQICFRQTELSVIVGVEHENYSDTSYTTSFLILLLLLKLVLLVRPPAPISYPPPAPKKIVYPSAVKVQIFVFLSAFYCILIISKMQKNKLISFFFSNSKFRFANGFSGVIGNFSLYYSVGSVHIWTYTY